jgi:hypothetical protein
MSYAVNWCVAISSFRKEEYPSERGEVVGYFLN